LTKKKRRCGRDKGKNDGERNKHKRKINRLYPSLHATVSQSKNCPFGVNIANKHDYNYVRQ